jgi:pyridoxal phosphate enzyme (YggS family)
MFTVQERLTNEQERIERAARSADRNPAEILLVAVSKTMPASTIREAYAAGQRDFGENYVQELTQKAEALADLEELRWHMIGHVQRNKAKHVVRHASVVHSVDSARLATELEKRWLATDTFAADTRSPRRLPVLIEVNVGGEAQKSGCLPGEVEPLLAVLEALPGLKSVGLMTVPPHTEDPEGALPFFEKLFELREKLGGAARLPELSMGMSHDLEHAIVSGATVVRVGTAIFGPRE